MSNSSYSYKLGGTLEAEAPSYVKRQADEDFYQGLKSGEFCYVLNARQMGKSSLQVRTRQRLEADGIRCAVIDITEIGTAEITPEQWYAGMINGLVDSFSLYDRFDLDDWWASLPLLSPVQRFGKFLESVLLLEILEPIVIFVDEIDSVRSLPFNADDFFAIIRNGYNKRATDLNYRRLTFALIGAATPIDLIRDPLRTPFNVGRSIELAGFQLADTEPLQLGLGEAREAIGEILTWTGGQPFLTQKLCALVRKKPPNPQVWGDRAVEDFVAGVVREGITENWEGKDDPVHLKTIRGRVLEVGEAQAGRLLGLYQRVLEEGSIATDDSGEQMQLRLSGLVMKRDGRLWVFNRIYQQVFDRSWVAAELATLRPAYYGVAIAEWLESGDESRLLRGEALRDAIGWADGKQLSDEDSRFLRISQEAENRSEKEANQILATARHQAETELAGANVRLAGVNRQIKRRTAIGGSILAGSLVVAAIAVPSAIKARSDVQEAQTTLTEAKDITQVERSSTLSLRQFEKQPVLALVSALEAGQQLQTMVNQKTQTKDAPLINQKLALTEYPAISPIYALHQILSTIENRDIPARQGNLYSLSWNPDGNTLATSGDNGSIKLWKRTGEPIKTLITNHSLVQSLSWTPDGKILTTGGADGTVEFWNQNGDRLKALAASKSIIRSVSWNNDGKILATGGDDGSVKLWSETGQLLKTIAAQQDVIYGVSWSNDGKILATGGKNGNVKLWSRSGELIRSIATQQDGVNGVSWTPDGQTLATGGINGSVKLWKQTGEALKTIDAHRDRVTSLGWSADGQSLATGGQDGTIKLWKRSGDPIKTLTIQQNRVRSVSWNPDGQTLATGGDDSVFKLWTKSQKPVKTIRAEQSWVRNVTWTNDGQTLATGGENGSLKLWTRSGELIQAIEAHKGSLYSASWTPDGQTLATGGADGNIKLWTRKGDLIQVFAAGQESVRNLSWNADGQTLASGGQDGSIKLWSRSGNLLKTFTAHQGNVYALGWNADGQTLATGGEDGSIKLWKRSGEPVKTLVKHQGRIRSLSWAPDGKTLATGGEDGNLILWTQTGDWVKTIATQQRWVRSLSWRADGQILATGGEDGSVKLWTRSGELMTTIAVHQTTVRGVSWNPDGQLLATAGADQTIKLWNTDDLETLLTKGCNWLNSYLIGSPQVLQTLPQCQTPDRLRAAAPNLITDSETLARAGNLDAAIQGFTTAKQWDSTLNFDPIEKANQIAKGGK
jgi:WD40 repeat protein